MKKAGSFKKISLSAIAALLILVSSGYAYAAVSANDRAEGEHSAAARNTAEANRIIDAANQLFIQTDERNWPQVKLSFAEKVLFDMSSAGGGEPAMVTPRHIVDGWEAGLAPMKAIHHQIGNYRVDVRGNEADLFCYGIAYHYLPNESGKNTRTFVGSYNLHFIKVSDSWKIDKFKFNLKFIDGNAELGVEKPAQ
ncbi:hypothetical protein J2T17_005662 [Paenibacillus mucilaginosus]|uniref:nuclear transport factor 2 family protein n=1 Tax=Paenibacillus mucilaginosus TaxID=61624 RepID=UPI003D1E02E3